MSNFGNSGLTGMYTGLIRLGINFNAPLLQDFELMEKVNVSSIKVIHFVSFVHLRIETIILKLKHLFYFIYIESSLNLNTRT